jgi:hypothetical protein
VHLRAIHRDESGVVISWLVRILLGLALLGVVVFDAGAIAVNYFSVEETADEVALAVSTALKMGTPAVPNLECNRRSTVPACAAVYDIAREHDVRIVSARFDQQGTFYVHLRSTARTLIVRRIGAIEGWGKATASAEAATN